MRVSNSILLALPALTLAQEQVPLMDKVKGFFNKASSIVSSAAPNIPSPANAAADKVAEAVVSPLTLDNWEEVIKPSTGAAALKGPEEWMVYITGGNKTCYGLCGNATRAWNNSVPLLAASKNPPHLAILDCENEQILCNSWSASTPSIYHFLLPQPLPDQSKPATTARFIQLNRTSVTATEIVELHTKENYKKTEPYEGPFHPFDGFLKEYGIAVPLSYVLTAFSKMPSWLPMIAISFLSRSFMNKRMNPQQGQQGAQAGARPQAAGGR